VNVGAAEVLIILCFLGAIAFVFLGVPIWAIVDAARRPKWQYQATGQSKVLWIVLPAVGLFLCGPVSVVAAIVYFASVRPKLARAQPYGDTWSYGYGDRYGYGSPPPPPRPPPPGPRRPGPPPG
jgi:hypothetical protein